MGARVVVGRAGVLREVRAAGHLMAALAAPVTARAPWLTVALNSADSGGRRPVAVVVDDPARGRGAVAFLVLRRSGLRTAVTLLGDDAPQPGGRPSARLLARDDAAAERLADGIAGLVRSLAGPWSLRLTGLPLGDRTVRRLAASFPTSTQATLRSRALVDGLDDLPGGARRTTAAAEIERRLPVLLRPVPDGAERRFLRAAVRLHAAIGQVEVATAPGAALLTLLDGPQRWPWRGTGAGCPEVMGAPLAQLTATGPGRWAGGLRRHQPA